MDQPKQHTDDIIRIVIPYKDQDAAVSVKRQLRDLRSKVRKTIHPVFTNRKLKQDLNLRTQALHRNPAMRCFSSVTCAMQIILGTQRATFTRALTDTVKRRHLSTSIITKNITLLFRTISLSQCNQ